MRLMVVKKGVLEQLLFFENDPIFILNTLMNQAGAILHKILTINLEIKF